MHGFFQGNQRMSFCACQMDFHKIIQLILQDAVKDGGSLAAFQIAFGAEIRNDFVNPYAEQAYCEH